MQVHIGGYLRTTEPTGPGQQFQSFRVSQTVVHPRFTTGINVPASGIFLFRRASSLCRLPCPVSSQLAICNDPF